MENTNPGSQRAWLETQYRINATQFAAPEKPGEPNKKTLAFREHAKTRPGRVAQAARTLPKSKSFSTSPADSDERKAEVEAWKKQRPGGGSPSGATHEQWVGWGSRNPNRGSNAGRTQRSQPRKPKQ